MILLLRCPKCKNTMKYQNMTSGVFGKSKRCVYCGKNMSVKDSIIKKMSEK